MLCEWTIFFLFLHSVNTIIKWKGIHSYYSTPDFNFYQFLCCTNCIYVRWERRKKSLKMNIALLEIFLRYSFFFFFLASWKSIFTFHNCFGQLPNHITHHFVAGVTVIQKDWLVQSCLRLKMRCEGGMFRFHYRETCTNNSLIYLFTEALMVWEVLACFFIRPVCYINNAWLQD